MILTIRTDKPEAEIGLFVNQDKVGYVIWTAHRLLAETIHRQIEDLLRNNSKEWQDISAIACYKGPGSFTGLRIGLTVANSLAYSLEVPIVTETGGNWIKQSIDRISKSDYDVIAVPTYGHEPNVTSPKK